MLTMYSVRYRTLVDGLVVVVGGGSKRERSGSRHGRGEES